MDAEQNWQWVVGFSAGLSALGFYLFLAVWVGMLLWSRTKEKLAIQETLQTLIKDGKQLNPEIVDALRRTKSQRTPAQVLMRARKFRYWGYFLVGLGIVITLNGLRYSDSPVKDLREMSGAGIVLFVIPGLFCLAHSVITTLTNRSSQD